MMQKCGWSLIAPFALTLGLAACSGSTTIGEEGSTEAATNDTQAQVDSDTKVGREHGFHGPEKMMRAALGELDLSADQKVAVDKALDGAFPEKNFQEGKMKPFFALLASEIRAGSIDESALQSKLGELGDKNEHRAKMVAAFQAIHDTLTTEQRAALVTKLQDGFAKFGGGDHKFREGGREGREARNHDGKGGGRMHGPLGFLLHGLDVDDAQREKIKAALDAAGLGKPGERGERGEMKAKMQAALEAFKLDQFDASAVVPEGDGARHLDKMVKSMAVIVPLLDATQRDALATKIEEGPKFHGPGAHAPHPDDDEAE